MTVFNDCIGDGRCDWGTDSTVRQELHRPQRPTAARNKQSLSSF